MRLATRAMAALVLAGMTSGMLRAAAPPPDLGEQTGGATTVAATGRNAFSLAAANLSDEERTRFAVGNSFFRRNWVEAPSSTSARDGLGPHFIARSCGGCHMLNGRGAPPELHNGAHEQPVALLMRLSVPGEGPHGGVKPEPVYGDQFNNFAIQGVRPEGLVSLRYEPLPGRFADGTPYTLLKPFYGFDKLGYGPMSPDVMTSPRIAPQLIGVGLLEAIAETEIVGNAQAQAQHAGPIKGQPNMVWDSFGERNMVGRFGWKANVASIAEQTAAAFVGDMGITSSKFPHETCTATQTDCLAAPHGAKNQGPEIDDATLANVVFYQSAIAPPARRNARNAQVLRGQKLFTQLQCAICHRPSYVTTQGPFPNMVPSMSTPAVNGQTIWPYTDLLLHDMGSGLADGRPDHEANGEQWKTPPLWGTGLLLDVNEHQRLLHDGRARGVLEAVLWHGGEAEASKQAVRKLKRAEREALVKFVESL